MLHYVSFGAFAYRYDMARFAGQPWNSAAAEVVVEEFFGIGEEHRIVDGKHATRRIGDVFIIVCDVLQVISSQDFPQSQFTCQGVSRVVVAQIRVTAPERRFQSFRRYASDVLCV